MDFSVGVPPRSRVFRKQKRRREVVGTTSEDSLGLVRPGRGLSFPGRVGVEERIGTYLFCWNFL